MTEAILPQVPVTERIEKVEPTYSPTESKALDALPQNYATTPINGHPVSIELARSLAKSDISAAALTDETTLVRDLLATPHHTQEQRENLWRMAATLPLTAESRATIFQNLLDTASSREKLSEEPPIDTDEEEKIMAWTSMKTMLPYGALPQLGTFLANVSNPGELRIPPAVIRIQDANGQEAMRMVLTPAETAVAMGKMYTWIGQIRGHREAFAKQYRREHRLPDDHPVSLDTLKTEFLPRIAGTWTAQLGREKVQQNGEIVLPGEKFALHFTQYKRGLSPEARKTLSSPEKIADFFAEKKAEKEGLALSKPTMIPLSEIPAEVLTGGAVFVDPSPTERIPTYQTASQIRSAEQMNELQTAYTEITRATKSGDWQTAIETYVKYLDYWPQYLEHRIAAYDIYRKYEQGTIPRLPEMIVSIASGPHEELRAQGFLAETIPGYTMPQIINLDITQGMFDESKKHMDPALNTYSTDIVGDMRNIQLPDQSADLVECSSFDNLSDDQERKNLIVDAVRVAKDDGILRFMIEHRISDETMRVLEKHGIQILERNTIPRLTKEAQETIRREKGSQVLGRIKGKLQRHKYFVALKTGTVDAAILHQDLQTVPSFFAPETNRSSRAIQREIESNAAEGLDYSVYLTVAQNPTFFLEKRHLSPEHVRTAIRALQTEIDPPTAIRLLRIYATNPELAGYTYDLLQTIGHLPDVNRNIPVSLLHSSNPDVRLYMEGQIAEKPHLYISRLLDEKDIPQETLKEIFDAATYDTRITDTISTHIKTLFHTGDIEKLHALMGTPATADTPAKPGVLPPNVILDLPLAMRFSPDTAPLYFRFAQGDIRADQLNDDELKKLMHLPTRYSEQKKQFLADTITSALHSNDLTLVRQTIQFCKEHTADPAVTRILSQHHEAFASLTAILPEEKPMSAPATTQLDQTPQRLTLFDHPNPAVRVYMEAHTADDPKTLVTNLLNNTDVSPTVMQDILAGITYDAATIQTITTYMRNAFQAENIDELRRIADALPSTLQLTLPIAMRFSPDTAPLYFRFAQGSVLSDSLNGREAEQLMRLSDDYAKEKTAYLLHSIHAALTSHDGNEIRRVMNLCIQSENTASIEAFLLDNSDLVNALVAKTKEHTLDAREASLDRFLDRFIAKQLVKHANSEVRDFIQKHPYEAFPRTKSASFIRTALSDKELSPEALQDILAIITGKSENLTVISHRLIELSGRQDTQRVQIILSALPPTVHLDLPLALRFDPTTRDLYFSHAVGDLQRERLTSEELAKVMTLPNELVEQKIAYLSDVIDQLAQSRDVSGAAQTLAFCLQHKDEPAVASILTGKRGNMMQLASTAFQSINRSTLAIRTLYHEQPRTFYQNEANQRRYLEIQKILLERSFDASAIPLTIQYYSIAEAVNNLIAAVKKETSISTEGIIRDLYVKTDDYYSNAPPLEKLYSQYLKRNLWSILRKNGESEETIATFARKCTMNGSLFSDTLLAYVNSTPQTQVPQAVWEHLAGQVDFIPDAITDKRAFTEKYLRYKVSQLDISLPPDQVKSALETMLQKSHEALQIPTIPLMLQTYNMLSSFRFQNALIDEFWDILKDVEHPTEEQIDAYAIEMASFTPGRNASVTHMTTPILWSYIERRNFGDVPPPVWENIVRTNRSELLRRRDMPQNVKQHLESTYGIRFSQP